MYFLLFFQALELLCSYLFKQVSVNHELAKLPNEWLHHTLSKLQSQQQVFILRRSAGFAYGFLSILKAESKHSEPNLLLLTMNSLMKNLYSMNSSSKDPAALLNKAQAQAQAQVHWRTCVHSLNIIRLFIMDTSLAPHMDNFISEIIMLVIDFFNSSRWGIRFKYNKCVFISCILRLYLLLLVTKSSRNSAMMVFTAIVQRTVDKEKNDISGFKAISAEEFFRRFPKLFTFFLSKLAEILNDSSFTLDEFGGKCAISFKSDGNHQSKQYTENPSLYPILLLLSKLRPCYRYSRQFDFPLSNNNSNIYDYKEIKNNENLLNKLVEFIKKCNSMPKFQIRSITTKALLAFIPLEESLQNNSFLLNNLSVSNLSLDEIHGVLMQLLENVSSAKRYLDAFGKEDNLSQNILSILKSSFLNDFNKLYPLYIKLCPPIQYVLLQTSLCLYNLLKCPVSYNILLDISYKIVNWLLISFGNKSQTKNIYTAPMQPLVWKSAIETVVNHQINQLDGTQLSFDKLKNLFQLAEYSVLEIREGVLLGIEIFLMDVNVPEFVSPIPPAQNSSLIGLNITEEQPVLSDSFDKNDPLDHRRCFILRHLISPEVDIFKLLLLLMHTERFPPLINKVLNIFNIIIGLVDFTHLHESIRSEIIKRFDNFINTIVGFHFSRNQIYSEHDLCELKLAPTDSSAHSIIILGWIMKSEFKKLDINLSSLNSDFSLTYIRKWMIILDLSSQEFQNTSIRNASSESLINSSGLKILSRCNSLDELNEKNKDYHIVINISLSLWMTSLKLMQDDDIDIRNAIASCVIDAIKLFPSSNSSQQNFELPPNFLAPQEYIIESMSGPLSELLFLYFSTCNGNDKNNPSDSHSLSLKNSFSYFMDELDNSIGQISYLEDFENSDMYEGKIFTAEQENLFFEKITVINVLSISIGKCLYELASVYNERTLHLDVDDISPIMSNPIENFTTNVTERYFKNVQSIFILLKKLENNLEMKDVKWITGIYYHYDIFRLTYGNLKVVTEVFKNFYRFLPGQSFSNAVRYVRLEEFIAEITAESIRQDNNTTMHNLIKDILAPFDYSF